MQTDTQGAAANTQLALARDFVVKYFVAIDRQDLACGAACKIDPLSGVIGV